MTPELTRFDTAARKAFPGEFASGAIFNLGVFNCRRKNNTANGPYSEHSWSNAKDYGIKNWDTPAGNALGDRFAKWARSSGLASEVFWEVAQHFNHVHVTATPRKNYDNKQIPPCALPPEDDDMEAIKGIQRSLNAAGFKGKDGKVLTVDGIWGTNTEFAFTAMCKAAKQPGPKGDKGDQGIPGKPGATVAQVVTNIIKRLTNG